MFKRIMSILLVLAMAVSYVPVAAAADETGQSEVSSDVQLAGDSDVGNLLSNTLNTENVAGGNQNEDPSQSSIWDLRIEGNTAAVQFYAAVDAKLVVALYSEEGQQLLASGSQTVEAGSRKASVKLDAEQMPKYFTATAYLLDAATDDPLCEEYHSSLYTESIQDIQEAKASDFEPEKVLNLDGDDNTNFVVFGDNTVNLGDTPQGITDKGNGTYVFANADERLRNLKTGESVVWRMDNGELRILVAASVSVSGNKVTVTENSNATMDDVFEVVKIEAVSSPNTDRGTPYSVNEEVDFIVGRMIGRWTGSYRRLSPGQKLSK